LHFLKGKEFHISTNRSTRWNTNISMTRGEKSCTLKPENAVLLDVWDDLWKWVTTILTQKTLQNHANWEIQLFMFTLIAPIKLSKPSRACIFGIHIWKAAKYLKDVTLKKQCVPSQC
jgi:hypothetical protein